MSFSTELNVSIVNLSMFTKEHHTTINDEDSEKFQTTTKAKINSVS